MKSCQEIIAALRGSEDDAQMALEWLYKDERFRKYAMYVYTRRRSWILPAPWHDFFVDCLVRFREKARRGLEIRNCIAYFGGICWNVAQDYGRDKDRNREDPTGDELPETGATNPAGERQLILDDCIRLLDSYIARCSPQCQAIFEVLSLFSVPLSREERQELRRLLMQTLRGLGYEFQEANLAAIVANCRARLEGLAGTSLNHCFDPI